MLEHRRHHSSTYKANDSRGMAYISSSSSSKGSSSSNL